MSTEVEPTTELGPLGTCRYGAGSPDGSTLVFLHGFSQNCACMGPVARYLADAHQVLAVDLPGHGRSSMLAGADLWRSGELVARTCGPAIYVGYSMGARVGLHLVLTRPEAVDSLVLIGATAGITDGGERRRRAAADNALADAIIRDGVAAFVDQWLRKPLFSSLPADMRFVEERLGNDATSLATSLRQTGTGQMDPLWDRLDEISVPVLILTGARDDKFTALGSELQAAIGQNAQFISIPDAGHSVHLEQPRWTASAIEEFLASSGSDQQADRQKDRIDDLHRSGTAQHTDETLAGGA